MRAQMAYCGPQGIPHSEFLAWDVDDQAKAIGWMHEEAQHCSSCGTAPWEWLEDPNAYEAYSKVCPGCNAIGNEQKQRQEHAEKVPGLKTSLRRPEVAGDSTDH